MSKEKTAEQIALQIEDKVNGFPELSNAPYYKFADELQKEIEDIISIKEVEWMKAHDNALKIAIPEDKSLSTTLSTLTIFMIILLSLSLLSGLVLLMSNI